MTRTLNTYSNSKEYEYTYDVHTKVRMKCGYNGVHGASIWDTFGVQENPGEKFKNALFSDFGPFQTPPWAPMANWT